MTGRTKLRIFWCACSITVLIAVSGAAYYINCNIMVGKRMESISRSGKYTPGIANTGEVYSLKLDDDANLAWLDRNFGRQKKWRKRDNANVALVDGGGIPAKFIYVVYDRTDRRILETGVLQV